MLNLERQNKILEIIKKKHSVDVHFLAKTLYVSEATIRRDLTSLKDLGVIERSHGGAFLRDIDGEPSILIRKQKNEKEKMLIATLAEKIIPKDFGTLFLDSSTTALTLAKRLNLSYKTVVTNHLQVAEELSSKPNINIILLGGALDVGSNSTLGSYTLRQLTEFSFDLMISSCASIKDGCTFERSLDQRELKLCALQRSKTKILLADNSKFYSHGTFKLENLEFFDKVITDKVPPRALLSRKINFVYG